MSSPSIPPPRRMFKLARRTRIRTRPRLEFLEDRTLLSRTLNPFASFSDQVVAPHGIDSIKIQIGPNDFQSPSHHAVLRLDVQGDGTNPLNPGLIQITPKGGAKVLNTITRRAGTGRQEEVILVRLTPGTFVVDVGGKRKLGGTFGLDVSLAGNVSGNFSVGSQDLQTIQSLIGVRSKSPRYLPGADVDGNGTINRSDLKFARMNLGASTEVRPLSFSMSVDPSFDPTGRGVVTQSAIVIEGLTEPRATVALDQGDSGTTSQVTSADGSGHFHFAIQVGIGITPLHVVASDAFGQHATFDRSVTRNSVVDVQAPVVSIQSPAPNLLSNSNVTLTGRVTDDLSGVANLQAQVDAGPFVDIPFDSTGNFQFATNLPLDGSVDGVHNIRLKATDQAKNVSSPLDYSFTLDTVPPIVRVSSPSNGLVTTQNVKITGMVNDDRSGVATFQASVDGAAYSNVCLSGTPRGTFQFHDGPSSWTEHPTA